jgi:dephospho-CoA kinase
MLIVGITGGIGSGKGLATEFFRRRGAAIIDADEVGRELTQPGSSMMSDIAAAFGSDLVLAEGGLDRGKLAERVFGHPELVSKLNSITHPAIVAEIRNRLDRLAKEGSCRVACVVAPLLLEAGCRDMVERVVVMVADEDERVRRVMARDGLTEEEVRRRIAAQMSPAEQRRRADWVVDTAQGRAAAVERLQAIWEELSHRQTRPTCG